MNDIEQLARFMQARDARIHGFVIEKDGQPDEWHPTWEETGTAQQDYLGESTAYLRAVEALGYRKVPV